MLKYSKILRNKHSYDCESFKRLLTIGMNFLMTAFSSSGFSHENKRSWKKKVVIFFLLVGIRACQSNWWPHVAPLLVQHGPH